MGQKNDMRAEALDTLIRIDRLDREDLPAEPEERGGIFAGTLIRDTLMRLQFLPRQDRAFYMRLCEGVTEQRIYLDYILDHYSKTPMRKCKPLIRNLLRLGAYQILFMDVPDAAVCNEAVALAKKRKFRNLSGFVNGVLRNLSRNKTELPEPDREKDPVHFLSVMYSAPEWLAGLLTDQYGEDLAEVMLDSFLRERPVSIRTTLSKCSPEELAGMLKEEGVTVEAGRLFPYAFSIRDFNYLPRLRAFREGYFTVQDESSMLPAHVAGLKEGDRVLDLCAAPGGKTLHAADRLMGSGRVIARDLTEYKTELIRENVNRIGCPQVEVEQWDARESDPDLADSMDVVFADLPCSGLGVIGRKNDIKYRVRESSLRELVTLQREILTVAWRYVKPGGQLIYSTCTVNQKENEENVRWILENTPLVPLPIEDRLPEPLRNRGDGQANMITLIPGKDPCDGFFLAAFTRPEASDGVAGSQISE